MAVYSLSLQIASNFAIPGEALFELTTSSTAVASVLEVGITMGAALTTVALGRPTSLGVGPTLVPFQAEEFDTPASGTNGAVAWSGLPPGIPTSFLRRVTFGPSRVHTVVWAFPEGLNVPVNNNLAVWFLAGGGTTADVWVTIEE